MNKPNGQEEDGPQIKSGVTGGRKAPRWTIAFLRALARTGSVRAAAEDAGIDHTTAYARRRTHPDFAGMWRGALVAHDRWVKGKGAEEIAALRAGPSTACGGPPPPGKLGVELIGSQLKRVGHDRWSERKEKLFFDELAATANVKRAAAAAGVSTNAVYARRMKHALFRAKWEAVLETGRAAIEMKLVEAANRSFDPEELDVAGVDLSLGNRLADGRVAPLVSVAEAIRIVQLHGSRTQREAVGMSLQQQADGMSGTDVDELRERVFKKIQRLRERDRRDRLAEGWTLDETHDCIVPPGWLRTV